MATFDVNWSGTLVAAAAAIVGVVLCPIGTSYAPATAANLAIAGRISGVAITPASSQTPQFTIQYSGEVANSITGLGPGAAAAVGINPSTGAMQRIVGTYPASTYVVGDCDAAGNVTLSSTSRVNPAAANVTWANDLAGSTNVAQTVSAIGSAGGATVTVPLGNSGVTGTFNLNSLASSAFNLQVGGVTQMSLVGSGTINLATNATLSATGQFILSANTLALETSGQVFVDAPTFTLRDAGHAAWLNVTSAAAFVSQVVAGATSVKYSQADNTTASATGATTTIQAQNATGATATGGALNLTSGTGTTNPGATNIQCGGVNVVSFTNNGGNPGLTFGTNSTLTFNGQAILATTSSVFAIESASTVFFDGTSVNYRSAAHTQFFVITAAAALTLTADAACTSVGINQNSISTASTNGANWTIQAQNTTGTGASDGGKLSCGGGTSTNGVYGTFAVTSPMDAGRLSYTFPSDANQTLTAAQSANNFLDIQAGVITTARTITISRRAATAGQIYIKNRTLQIVSFGWLTGTTSSLASGASGWFGSDGSNCISLA